MKVNRLAAAACLACSLLAGNAFADVVTLNPSAANAGAANGSVLSATDGAFLTEKATTNFASVLTIDSTPGAAGSIASTETGFFMVDGFSLGSQGVRTNYNIYALFTISGSGTWSGTGTALDPYVYKASPVGLSVTTTLYGSPGGAPLGAVTPSAGNPYGITPDATDFILGTASLLLPDKATATLGTFDNRASTEFGATLGFLAAAGTTGVGGFWQAPNPFLVDLSTSATGVPPIGGNGTTFAVVNGDTIITTNATALGVGSGSGNILFAVVPEPGSLALVGLALVGLGWSRIRRSNVV